MSAASADDEPKIGTAGFCLDCPYFTQTVEKTLGGPAWGKCRRFPPTPMAGAGNAQPSVKSTEWCGEHPLRMHLKLNLVPLDNPREQARPGPATRPAPAAKQRGRARKAA